MAKPSRWRDAIRANRRRMDADLASGSRRRLASPIFYGQYQVTLPLMLRYVQGTVLDAGCGDVPFKEYLADRASRYDTLDLFPRTADVTYVADIQAMPEVPDGAYSSAICLEVLEHVPDPFRAVRELFRVLAPGGVLIVSVPHLSRLHDEPHDFYRYTRYGLARLLEQAGFRVVHLSRRGGLFSFLGHQVSTVVLGSVWSVPVLREVAWFLNSWLVTRLCYRLDQIIDPGDVFAAGYSGVAVKPDSPSPPAPLPEGEGSVSPFSPWEKGAGGMREHRAVGP